MTLPGHWLHEVYTLLQSPQILFLLILNTSIILYLKRHTGTHLKIARFGDF